MQTDELITYARRQQVRADNLTVCYRKKQIDASFSCVCPVTDNELHNIILWRNLVPRAHVPFGQHQGMGCADQQVRGLWEQDWLWRCWRRCYDVMAHGLSTEFPYDQPWLAFPPFFWKKNINNNNIGDGGFGDEKTARKGTFSQVFILQFTIITTLIN